MVLLMTQMPRSKRRETKARDHRWIATCIKIYVNIRNWLFNLGSRAAATAATTAPTTAPAAPTSGSKKNTNEIFSFSSSCRPVHEKPKS